MQAWAAPREGKARLRSRETHVGTLTGIEMPSCPRGLCLCLWRVWARRAACAQVMGWNALNYNPAFPPGGSSRIPTCPSRIGQGYPRPAGAARPRALGRAAPHRVPACQLPRATGGDCARRLSRAQPIDLESSPTSDCGPKRTLLELNIEKYDHSVSTQLNAT